MNIESKFIDEVGPLPEEIKTVSDREYLEYENLLGLPTEQLKGGLVLDLGSGKSGQFVEEAKSRGINVVGLNPELKDPRFRRLIKPDLNFVAGEASNLPFIENAFDAVVGFYSVPYYSEENNEEQYTQVFAEINRVLKPGGSAYLFPIYGYRKDEDAMKKAIADLSNQCETELEYSDNGSDQGWRLKITKPTEPKP